MLAVHTLQRQKEVCIHYSSELGPIPRPMHGEVLEPVSIASRSRDKWLHAHYINKGGPRII